MPSHNVTPSFFKVSMLYALVHFSLASNLYQSYHWFRGKLQLYY